MAQIAQPNAEPIPGYRLIERLGRGGFGEVWKAEAPGGMHKAIKFVFGDLDSAGDDGKAAEQEFRSLNRVKSIRHPFLLTLERIEIVDGQLIIVSELADRNLWDRFKECVEAGMPGIPRDELIHYMEESAEALDLMNEHYQLQHLDIKPQNIFLLHRHVKVADFGLAKDLEGARADLTGGITPTYAPPETFDQWVSRQSDQYSLAIVYMEMLTGRRPFNGTSARQLIMQHMTAAPDLSLLSSPDKEAVARALSKKPDDRFRTCQEFVQALQEQLPKPTRPEPEATPAQNGEVKGDTASLVSVPTAKYIPNSLKSLPALITPKSKSNPAQPRLSPRLLRPTPEPKPAAVAPFAITGDGILAPAVMIGIGSMGLAAMRAFRRQLFDHFGQSTLPHFRWLYVDTDPNAPFVATRGSSSTALPADDVLLARLQRPTHYLSNDKFPPLDVWLNPETLYRISKDAVTDGTRSIGRLALVDHYQVLCQRIRTILETFLTAKPVEEANRKTGLGIRSSIPSVYIAASLAGGTGSGMLLDMAYLIRRELRRLGWDEAQLVGLLGIPDDSNKSIGGRALSNTYAALTELDRLGSPGCQYEAQFDRRERPVKDKGRAFHKCTLFRTPEDRDVIDETAARIAHVQFTELLTRMGQAVYSEGSAPIENRLAVVGLQRVVYPKLLVQRVAAWKLSKAVLESWLGGVKETAALFFEKQWAELQPDFDQLRATFEGQVQSELGMTPLAVIDSIIESAAATLTQDEALCTPARIAFGEIVKLFGMPATDETKTLCIVDDPLTAQIRELSSQLDAKFESMVLSLLEQPGQRVVAADQACRLLADRLRFAKSRAEQAMRKAESELAGLVGAIDELVNGPGAATQKTISTKSATRLQQWAIAQLDRQYARSCIKVYEQLLSKQAGYAGEINFVRNQLAEFLALLNQSEPSVLLADGVYRTAFPDGARTVADMAERVVFKSIRPEEVREFDHGVQALIRHEFRSLLQVCKRPSSFRDAALKMLFDQAMRFVEPRIPRAGVSELISTRSPNGGSMETLLAQVVAAAFPKETTRPLSNRTILGLSERSQVQASHFQQLCPNDVVQMCDVDDQLIVWRESTFDSAEIRDRFSPYAADYAGALLNSAFSRRDVAWMVPQEVSD